ncbi:MAG: TRAP transporter small permease subunit [Deltaproteobacteria bacterium]|nr:TRAP transporter small permease subunit [Candidatus Anaeroferrophillacea bacterium]
MLERFSRILNRMVERLLLVLGTAICLILFAQVGFRYAGASLGWSEEVSRHLLVAITFLGGSAAYRRANFIGLKGIGHCLGPVGAGAAVRLLQFLSLALFVVVAWFGTAYVFTAWHHRSTALGIPMGIPYAVIPAAAVIFIVHILADMTTAGAGPER